MRNYLYLPVLACSTLFIFSSCNKHIYVPNTVNEPLLKEKHEFKGSISPNNYQAAFALTNNFGIMANGQYVYDLFNTRGNDSDIFVDNDTRGGLIEGAVGYFKPLDSKKRMVFDVYGGYGNGSFKTLSKAYSANSSRPVSEYILRTHFNKYFIQPGIGVSHPVIEAAFTSRLSMLKFYNLHAGPKAFEHDSSRLVNYMSIGNKVLPLYEPAFTFRVGYRYVKFQMQLLFSVLLNDDTYGGYDFDEYFQPVALNMGVSINIARWYDEFKTRRR